MKKLSLYLTAIFIMTSFSAQAMHTDLSSIPLIPIEQELVREAIKYYGLESTKKSINNPSISAFSIDCGFNKNKAETDALTKKIFDEIEEIESRPENKGNLRTKRNHFSFRSWYHRDWRNPDFVYVTMKSSNIKELNEICDSYKE